MFNKVFLMSDNMYKFDYEKSVMSKDKVEYEFGDQI